MRKKIDYSQYIGKKINRLTICGFSQDKILKNGCKVKTYECLCECGNKVVVNAYNVIRGTTKSCGCLKEETIKRTGQNNKKHGGMSKDSSYEEYRLYKRWEGMKSRCNNPNHRSYNHYGGRGIKVCDEWNNSYKAFKNWALQNGYSIELSLDRINVDGDYTPDNCRWVDQITQGNNKRKNRIINVNGESHTLSEWARATGKSTHVIHYRLSTGKYDSEEAVYTDDIRCLYRKELTFGGETHSILEWSKITGITVSVINYRINNNWDTEKILTTPMTDYKKIKANGEEHSIYEWADILSVTPRVIYLRLKKGWSEEDAVTIPKGEAPDNMPLRNKKWSDDEIQTLKKMHSDGLSYTEIGEELGRSRNAVRAKIHSFD